MRPRWGLRLTLLPTLCVCNNCCGGGGKPRRGAIRGMTHGGGGTSEEEAPTPAPLPVTTPCPT
eukprot:12880892-Prorocentrum_lima.AAC.1